MTIEERLDIIESRNERVEYDKAWETSWARRILVMAVTYVVVGLVLTQISEKGAWVNAIIPTCGYLLSTFSLPPLKALWIKRQIIKDKEQ
jgi:hypothetical protein